MEKFTRNGVRKIPENVARRVRVNRTLPLQTYSEVEEEPNEIIVWNIFLPYLKRRENEDKSSHTSILKTIRKVAKEVIAKKNVDVNDVDKYKLESRVVDKFLAKKKFFENIRREKRYELYSEKINKFFDGLKGNILNLYFIKNFNLILTCYTEEKISMEITGNKRTRECLEIDTEETPQTEDEEDFTSKRIRGSWQKDETSQHVTAPGLVRSVKGRNMTKLFNVAEVARRYCLSAHAVAALLSACMVDMYVVSEDDTSLTFDHNKVSPHN